MFCTYTPSGIWSVAAWSTITIPTTEGRPAPPRRLRHRDQQNQMNERLLNYVVQSAMLRSRLPMTETAGVFSQLSEIAVLVGQVSIRVAAVQLSLIWLLASFCPDSD